ncbi:hypothetical protein FB45DRAFT_939594 [Roridomyces roridus]|uniref:Peptidase M20 dimerisation domain-containing protein n=1 Tax=Roridomyces roridus TaxID=1738132 RepID=A0AAD7B776_9AGAR|nr:hypothetical protein FB45DRAFT_939594 [Roridomyces roridus]
MRGLPLDERPRNPTSLKVALFRMIVLALSLFTVTALVVVSHDQHFAILHTGRTNPRDFHRLPVQCPAQIPGQRRGMYADRLRGAVRVRTETFDGAPTVGDDAWYDKFYDLEAYLVDTFPDVFGSLQLKHFATHGLLLTWKGSDASLQPLVLMAHQDTVPVPEQTLSRWTHPPFEAVLDDDGWIWGRGVADCKSLLVAHLSAVSELLKAGFKPKRTVHLSFGFDEEGGGVHSARAMAAHLEDIYGLDSIFMIVDEGGGIQEGFGQTWVAPSTGEKGSVNIQLSVNVPGGHSSIPPAHTGIGILSAIVSTVEANPPPVFTMCLAEHGTIDAALKKLLQHERTWPAAAQWMAERNPGDAARLSTTQAVDIIGGGVKVNALPEEAHAIVNHRFGEEPPAGEARYLRLSTPGGAEASPVTPAKGNAWEVFAATSRHLYPDAIVAPYLTTGGTDTRSFVNLTRAIFRFQAVRDKERVNAHTVDERLHLDGHLNSIAWVHALMQNVDAFRE